MTGRRRARIRVLARSTGQERTPRRTFAGPTGGTVRGRLATILAFPAVTVVILLGVVAAGEVSAYQTSTATSRAVSLSLAVQDLIQQLQTERGVTAGLLGGNVSFRDELAPVRKLVDTRRLTVERLTSGGGAVEGRVRAAVRELDGLTAIRVGTDTSTIKRAAAYQFFTARIAALAGVDYGLERSSDEDLARGVATLQALADLKESTAQERAFLNGVFSAGGFAEGEFVQYAAMRAAKQAALDRFNRQATKRQRDANRYVLDTGAARTAAHFEQTALNAADGRHVVVNPQSWWSALTTVLDDMQRMQLYVGAEIRARAETLQNSAAMRIGGLLGVVGLSFAGAIALLVAASRSITRPLAALAAEADDVAKARLPKAVARVQATGAEELVEPPDPVRVPARASSEVQAMAGALDRVQTAAYGLALEQAVLRQRTTDSLANLGRRSQNLLRRQLGFITRLEQEETDPSGLANLFELDHLATRMRRNAESLLVLAGAATPRQWATPLPVADVIRAAVSEVEEYRRVTLRRIDDGSMSGAVVSGVAHILAELVENGLTFSPPDCEVEIQGRQLGGSYLIAITDQGVGMSVDDMAVANARLRGETDFVLAPSRYLGHHVVGHLARKLGVDVQLSPSPVTGVTARVTLPENLLAAPTAVPARVVEPIAQSTLELPAIVASAPASVDASRDNGAEPVERRRGLAIGDVSATGDSGSVAMNNQPYRAVDAIEYIVTPPVPISPVPARPVPTGAAPTQVGAASLPVASAPLGPDERTRNGLRKRPPRARPAGGRPAQPAQRPETARVEHSPTEVRARLSSLRAGVQRREDERQTAAMRRSGQRGTAGLPEEAP